MTPRFVPAASAGMDLQVGGQALLFEQVARMAVYVAFFLLAYAYFLIHYFVPNGFFYWLCWKSNWVSWAAHRIQKDREPRPDQIRTEIKTSLRSLAWYAGIATFVFYCYRQGYGSITTDPAPMGYHLASLVVLLLLHDTCFYWVHRLLHVRPIYRLIHKHHHDSRAPTPWASYSLSNGEAIIQCPLWVLCFTMPVHPAVVLTVLFLQNIYDTFGHLGYEFFPTWMLRNKWILAVQATPTHHDAHHRYFQGNYSHYFNVWDWLMGTELEQYFHLCETAHETAGTHDGASPVGAIPQVDGTGRPGGEPDVGRSLVRAHMVADRRLVA